MTMSPQRPPRSSNRTAVVARSGSLLLAFAGCHGGHATSPSAPGERHHAVFASGTGQAALGGVAIDAAGRTVATVQTATSSLWLLGNDKLLSLPSHGSALAWAGDNVAVALSIHDAGEPGAMIALIDPRTGTTKWTSAFTSTDWAIVSSLAATSEGEIVVGGTFSGTLRIGSHVVSSAGRSDGFVARLAADGQPRWVERIGGEFADGVTAVAVNSHGVAIGGHFSVEADLRGMPLLAISQHTPQPDGFVAWLDNDGAPTWTHVFGSPSEDSVGGVAIDEADDVAVAATVRQGFAGVVDDGQAPATTAQLVGGTADGWIGVWDHAGAWRGGSLIGGADYDGLRSIAAMPNGTGFVVGGWFSGTMPLPTIATTLTARGGDDAFVASVSGDGTLLAATAISGDGRENIVGLASSPAGLAIALGFTAATTWLDISLDAPANPNGGAAVIVTPTITQR